MVVVAVEKVPVVVPPVPVPLPAGAGAGAAVVAVEVAMVVLAMLAPAAIVADSVRVARFAACAVDGVVAPVAQVRVQLWVVCLLTSSVAVATMKFTTACAVPDIRVVVVKVVVPQPEVVGAAVPVTPQLGKVMVT